MKMVQKEQIINRLRKGYVPVEFAVDPKLASIYKSAYKRLVDKQDLEFFMEIFEINEVLLRAWGFLGIYEILKAKSYMNEEYIPRLKQIILALLNDERKISYFGGNIEITSSLRVHHIDRICDLDIALTFEPGFQYVESFTGPPDEVVTQVIEKILTISKDPRVELLMIRSARKIETNQIAIKYDLINAFEKLGQNTQIKNKESVGNIFKIYLDSLEFGQASSKEELEKKKLLRNILRVAAILGLNLEPETLEFFKSLDIPFKELYQIAKNYKENEEFKNLLLKKIQETDNPHFMKDLLKALLMMREEIPNWRQLALDKILKFELIEGDLITIIQEVGLFDEKLLTQFMKEGEDWQVEFVREYLKHNPERMDEWTTFREQFISILSTFREPIEHSVVQKKELAIKIIIDLERKDMVKYCLENFKQINNEEIRKLALFALIHLGSKKSLTDLKKFVKGNQELTNLVKDFWSKLERQDWKFYY